MSYYTYGIEKYAALNPRNIFKRVPRKPEYPTSGAFKTMKDMDPEIANVLNPVSKPTKLSPREVLYLGAGGATVGAGIGGYHYLNKNKQQNT